MSNSVPAPLIELKSVWYSYPDSSHPALSDISLNIRGGEYVAVVGNNGSGKSTLVRLFNGLRLPSAGTVRVRGMDPGLRANLYQVRQRIALVFQSPVDQIVSTSVGEDVAFGPSNLGLPEEEIDRRVSEALAVVGLENERSRPTRSLSGGQQQKLAIAGSLAMKPECIIFDEATSMLDPGSKAGVMALMDRLRSGGTAIVHVTHDMDDAALAERIVALDAGRLVFDGPPATFFGLGESSALFGAEADDKECPAFALGLKLPKSVEAAGDLGLEPVPGESPGGLARRIVAAAGRQRGQVPQSGNDGSSCFATAHARDPIPSTSDDRTARATPDLNQALGAVPAFEYKAASFSYLRGTANEVAALYDLNLRLPAGARVAFVGATGSGKSTALQLLDALLIPSSGEVFSLGKQTSDPSANLRTIRTSAPLAIQRPESALFEIHAGDDVAFGPRNLGLSGRALVDRVSKWMGTVGLPYAAYRDRLSRGLSGGEKRKLALAGVLAMESEAVLLDEPTSNLDPASREAVFDIVERLSAGGKTVIFATHSMEEAARADYIAVFCAGELADFGTPREIFYDRYSLSWGIGLPYAARLAEALAKEGLDLGDRPLRMAELREDLNRRVVSASAEGVNADESGKAAAGSDKTEGGEV